MKLPKNCKIENCASEDRSRGAITQPWLDADAGVVVATDGRMMAVVPVDIEEGDASGYLSADALTTARKLVGKGQPVSIKANGSLAIENGPSFPRPELGVFPKWQQVMPEGTLQGENKPFLRLSFDASLLAEIVAAIGTRGVVLEIPAPEKWGQEEKEEVRSAIVVRPTSSSSTGKCESISAFGLLMPLRLS